MKQEREMLKLQAYLDHELGPREAAQVAEWLAGDEEARGLYEELRALKLMMAGNELERRVPMSREFYWTGIEQRIRAEETAPAHAWWQPPAWRPFWLRFGLPIAGAAALVALLIAVIEPSTDGPAIAASFEEIETPISEANSISFQLPEAGMTVVWIETAGQ